MFSQLTAAQLLAALLQVVTPLGGSGSGGFFGGGASGGRLSNLERQVGGWGAGLLAG